MTIGRWPIAAVLFAALTAGVLAEEPAAVPLAGNAAAAAAIRDADRALAAALAARDRQAFRALLADDVTFFTPAPAKGRDAFLKGWEPFFSPGGPALTFQPIAAEAAASGELGYSIGRWERSAGPNAEQGHYVTIWRKDTDGRWRATLDIGTQPTPKPAPAPQR